MARNNTITVKGLNRLEKAIDRSPQAVFNGLSNAIKTSLNIVRPILRQEAPRGHTGMLRRNIRVTHSGLEGNVGPNLDITPYALWVHEGTRPYVIRPTKKQALFWPGARHPVKKVNHPGIKPNRYVDRTFNRIKRPVEHVFEKEIDNIIRKIHN